VITVVLVFIAAVLLAALSGLIGDEVRGWLELVPRGILRLVAMRLPASLRQAVYNEEWLPELIFILRNAAGRPITRLITGTWYAVSMIRSAGRVSRSLRRLRGEDRSADVLVPGWGVLSLLVFLMAWLLGRDAFPMGNELAPPMEADLEPLPPLPPRKNVF
jgi:hypothetical protein